MEFEQKKFKSLIFYQNMNIKSNNTKSTTNKAQCSSYNSPLQGIYLVMLNCPSSRINWCKYKR